MFKNFFQHIPFFAFGIIQLELTREKMLLKFIADALERNAPLIPLLIAFSEDYDGSWNEKILELAYLLKNNESLPDALEQVGGLVPIGAIPLIRIGMETGQPASTLRMISDNMKIYSEGGQNSSNTSFAGYSISLLFVTILVISFLMVYIVPKFKKIAEDFNSDLPAVTVSLIDYYDLFVTWLPILIPCFIIIYFLAIPVIQYSMIHVTYLRKIRIVRLFTSNLWTPDILRGLSVSAESQKPLLDSVKILARHITNKKVCQNLSNAEIRIQNGKPVWQSLADEKIISQEELDIFEAAERTGNLPWALKSIASRRDARSNRRLMNFMAFVEPAFTIMFGIIVGLVVIGMFLPLVQMIHDVA